ncbi:MAG: dynamin family protein [Aliishimia sp.]
MTQSPRKPRIAFMGEFSAGKSTLTNLLLGGRPLPEKVTATRLSPVWMSHGSQTPYRITMDGTREDISLSSLDNIPLETTRVIRMFFDADILGICDLIDFPGISDPNMSPEVWQRVLSEVDAIIWCTHATQAWRQSEASVWDTIPQDVRDKSILLITRFDKLLSVRDENRVLNRLRKETEGLFGAMFPISLTDALAAGDKEEEFEAAGGAAFLVHLLGQIKEITETAGQSAETVYQLAMGLAAQDTPDGDHLADTDELRDEIMEEDEPKVAAPIVMPRRVQAASSTRRGRPERPTEASKVVNMPNIVEKSVDVAPEKQAISANDLKSVFQ